MKFILVIGMVLGALAVGLGAFGAHALEEKLSEKRKETYETSVKYHMYHALALLALGVLAKQNPVSLFQTSAIFFIVGIVLFSGSLYLLCILDKPKLGIITPFGGLSLIVGWLIAAFAVWKNW